MPDKWVTWGGWLAIVADNAWLGFNNDMHEARDIPGLPVSVPRLVFLFTLRGDKSKQTLCFVDTYFSVSEHLQDFFLMFTHF
jgi:hypothetical protein